MADSNEISVAKHETSGKTSSDLEYLENQLEQFHDQLEANQKLFETKKEEISKYKSEIINLSNEIVRSYKEYERIKEKCEQRKIDIHNLSRENQEIKDEANKYKVELEDCQTSYKEEIESFTNEIKEICQHNQTLQSENSSLKEKMREMAGNFPSNGQKEFDEIDLNHLKSNKCENKIAIQSLKGDNDNVKEEIPQQVNYVGPQYTSNWSSVQPDECLMGFKHISDEQPSNDKLLLDCDQIEEKNFNSKLFLGHISLSDIFLAFLLRFSLSIVNLIGLRSFQLKLSELCIAKIAYNPNTKGNFQREDIFGAMMRSATSSDLYKFFFCENEVVIFPIISKPNAGVLTKIFAVIKHVVWLFLIMLKKIFKFYSFYVAAKNLISLWLQTAVVFASFLGSVFSVSGSLITSKEDLIGQSLSMVGFQPRPFPLPG